MFLLNVFYFTREIKTDLTKTFESSIFFHVEYSLCFHR